MEGGNYIVSWCFGHLVELADASSYDERYAKWRYDDLPIVPESWMFEVTKDKAQQFKVLSALMKDKRVTELVCATDAGREGELIFRLVYDKAGCTKPFKRLWISSLEDSAIREGFNHLRDGKEYDRLYEAALSRSKADWIVGINGTRLFTTLYHKKLVVGRVQTPTLAMLVERDGRISTFQKEKYFNVHVGKGDLTADLEKVKTEEEAKKIAAACEKKQAVVSSLKREMKTINPPKLYDLTTLQREANRYYGFTAQQTLDLVQTLYEKKLLTYPRTDSQFITDDMEDTARQVIAIVYRQLPLFSGVSATPDIARVTDNSKVTDHHAILRPSSSKSRRFPRFLSRSRKSSTLSGCAFCVRPARSTPTQKRRSRSPARAIRSKPRGRPSFKTAGKPLKSCSRHLSRRRKRTIP